MKLALAQMFVQPGDVRGNLERAARHVREAANAGAEIVLLPEALPFGWTDLSSRAAEPVPEGSHFRFLQNLAREHRIYVCAGLVEGCEGAIYNSAVLTDSRGELRLLHRKIHELAIAHSSYAVGDRLGVADTPFGRIGLMICADGFAPGQVISRTLALMGADFILSPCAWAVPAEHNNQRDPYGKLWLDNYGAVTREFPVWIAGCSNVGPVLHGAWAGRKCIGCSLIVGPGGIEHLRGPYGESAEALLITNVQRMSRPRCGPIPA